MGQSDAEKKLTVWQKLDALHIEMRMDSRTERSDQRFMKALQDGKAEKNLDKLYYFIDGVERGQGFCRDPLVCGFLEQAFQEDPERLLAYLENREDVIDICVLLFMCETLVLQTFANLQMHSGIFAYECARQLFSRYCLQEDCRSGVIDAVRQLSGIDSELWARWIHKNEYQIKWQKLLGDVLSGTSEKAWKCYAENINLSLRADRGQIEAVTESYNGMAEEVRQKFLCENGELLCLRWEKELESIKKTHTIERNIIINAYTNIIAEALEVKYAEQTDWIREVGRWIGVLNNDMERWYRSASEMSVYYFADMTQLYLLLAVGRQRGNDFLGDDMREGLRILRFYVMKHKLLWEQSNMWYRDKMLDISL